MENQATQTNPKSSGHSNAGIWIMGSILGLSMIAAGVFAALSPSTQTTAASPTQTEIPQEKQFNHAVGGAVMLRERTRDPDSLKITSALVMPDDTVCYEYRSRNGFGGMGNATAMLFAGILLSHEDADYRKLWKSYCAGHIGNNLTEDANYGLDAYKKLHND